MTNPLSQIEQDIREALAQNDHERVAALTLRSYGSEILGFLIAQLRDEQQAEEVFSSFAEDLWRSLPGLTLQTSMRAYAYALARNAKHRYLDRDLRKQRRGVPLSQVAEVSRIVAASRTETAAHVRTQSKSKLAELRERLDADEQALLTLRVDRALEWAEIVEALGETGDRARAAARVRKRFQAVKEKLTRWAQEEGLLAADE